MKNQRRVTLLLWMCVLAGSGAGWYGTLRDISSHQEFFTAYVDSIPAGNLMTGLWVADVKVINEATGEETGETLTAIFAEPLRGRVKCKRSPVVQCGQ